eukprot:CAMPEP_0174371776 /NCGR_PEP_ID=MMETSP0811_2-20130205/101036_1 /TAXON_ID=73025 ORGANISM="Eutreptiella gymnastica-like, Strain CCMP1594" /NCGR_SAMPLE_ID=MMETSP0811_2 /ASSEMBLY_ACC=CAM_ASM_000667 /LENGTH=95 /DNA_ID=CAMNT_0015518499 /DNA_START=991 /DNA_END=1275 /DNA_ORIENTATION=-
MVVAGVTVTVAQCCLGIIQNGAALSGPTFQTQESSDTVVQDIVTQSILAVCLSQSSFAACPECPDSRLMLDLLPAAMRYGAPDLKHKKRKIPVEW